MRPLSYPINMNPRDVNAVTVSRRARPSNSGTAMAEGKKGVEQFQKRGQEIAQGYQGRYVAKKERKEKKKSPTSFVPKENSAASTQDSNAYVYAYMYVYACKANRMRFCGESGAPTISHIKLLQRVQRRFHVWGRVDGGPIHVQTPHQKPSATGTVASAQSADLLAI